MDLELQRAAAPRLQRHGSVSSPRPAKAGEGGPGLATTHGGLGRVMTKLTNAAASRCSLVIAHRETFEFVAFFGQCLAFFGQRFPFFGRPHSRSCVVCALG